jgi:hypothetical protein
MTATFACIFTLTVVKRTRAWQGIACYHAGPRLHSRANKRDAPIRLLWAGSTLSRSWFSGREDNWARGQLRCRRGNLRNCGASVQWAEISNWPLPTYLHRLCQTSRSLMPGKNCFGKSPSTIRGSQIVERQMTASAKRRVLLWAVLHLCPVLNSSESDIAV